MDRGGLIDPGQTVRDHARRRLGIPSERETQQRLDEAVRYDQGVAVREMRDANVEAETDGQILTYQAATRRWINRSPQYLVSLGPFHLNDVPGTATTQAKLEFFNTTIAVSLGPNDIKMQTAGRVVGATIVADATRSAGTATVQVRINNVATTFAAGDVVLDATNTVSTSKFVPPVNGLAYTAGQTLGVALVTSGWTPITANVQVTLFVLVDAV